MIKIGLTGGVATGKSSVGKILVQKGIEVISSDELAHAALLPEGAGYNPVVSEFGRGILLLDGKINRKSLGEIVFKDQAARKRLEGIIHPIVLEGIKKRFDDRCQQGVKIIVAEVPLLFEVGWVELFDYIWVVSATPEQQLQRLLKRDGLTEVEAKQRITAQMPLQEKEKRADAVIKNNNGLDSLEKQVSILLTTLE